MPPLGPFDEARLFAAFEQSGKRSLDLYNVSFFCGTLDEQGKPHGDIGLDDLIDSEGLRCQKMQEDIIWTGTLAIKKKDQTYKYLLETGRLSLIVEAARRDRANIGFSQWEAGVEIRIKGKYYLHGFRDLDPNLRFEISLTQKATDGQKDGRCYKLSTLTPECMQRSLRAIHQSSIMAFMRKADTRMGSRSLEWYEREYKKAFPRNEDPLADEGKPVHRREFYSAIAMHFDDPVFCKDIVRKRILSRQTVEEFKVKRARIMNLPRDERQGWGVLPPLSTAEVARSWKPDRNYEFPYLPRPVKQKRTEPGPSRLPVERPPPLVIEILDSTDDENDGIGVITEEQAPTLPALRNTVPQPPAQMPIRAPAPAPLTSVRPPRRVSDGPRRRRSLASSSRSRSDSIPPVYERSPSPLGGYATYRSKEQKDLSHTSSQRERLKKMAQDGVLKQDFMDDNFVWICPVETCRHIFRMKKPESWTEEVKRSMTSKERNFMETQPWRLGNEAAKQIIDKKIMRPHYDMHAADYGFGFKSDKEKLVDLE